MRIITLRDGRSLAYEEYGLPDGEPVILLHGTPGSRIWFSENDHSAGALPIRLITPERPGYGMSDPNPEGTLQSFATDIKELTDFLKLDKLSIASVSGGCPYALAFVHDFPERIQNTGIVSGVAPPEVTRGRMLLNNRIAFFLAKYLKPVFRYFAQQSRTLVMHNPDKYIKYLRLSVSQEDKIILDDPSVVKAFLSHVTEGYRHGIQGLELDTILISGRWGFDPRDIKTPVTFWHGRQDILSPLHMSEYLSSSIKDSRLRIFENSGHLLLDDPQKWKEFIQEFG